MFTRRWQYPSHIEPIRPPALKPAPDAWHPAVEQPLFRRANASYAYPYAWIPERQPFPPVGWNRDQLDPPIFRRPNAVYTYPCAAMPERQPLPLASTWYPSPEPPLYRRAQEVYSYPYAWMSEQQPLPPTTWFGNLADAVSRKGSLYYITDGGFVTVVAAAPPPVLVSEWLPASTDIFRPKANPVYTENTFAPVVPPPVFGWLPAIDQPVVPKRSQYLYDSSFFHPFPIPNPVTVVMSMWHQALSEPTRRGPSSAHITENVIPAQIIPKTVTVDMWFQQSEVPQSSWQRKTGTAQLITFIAQTLIPITPPVLTVISEQNTYIGTGFAEWSSTIDPNIGGG